MPLDAKRAADRGPIAAEAPLPGGIAQHCDGLRLRRGIPDVGLIEQAACRRLKAEGVVKRARHELIEVGSGSLTHSACRVRGVHANTPLSMCARSRICSNMG